MITYGIGTYAGVLIVVTGDIADIPGAIRTNLSNELARIGAPISTRATQTSADKAVANAGLAAALSA